MEDNSKYEYQKEWRKRNANYYKNYYQNNKERFKQYYLRYKQIKMEKELGIYKPKVEIRKKRQKQTDVEKPKKTKFQLCKLRFKRRDEKIEKRKQEYIAYLKSIGQIE